MLFRALDTYLPETQERTFVKLHGYINALNTRRNLVNVRYDLSEGLESSSIQLLKEILGNADIPSLLKMDNDYVRYTNALIYTRTDLDDLFDQTATGKFFTNMFVKSLGPKCREYIVPIHRSDYLSQLPLDSQWELWESVRAVRLMDIDSLELTFHTYTDQIVFKYDQPSRAVIGIDAVALVLQYVNYCKTFIGNDRLPIQLYLHRYVLNGILIDLEDLWLRNKYLSLIKNNSSDDTVSSQDFYGYFGGQYSQAIQEVENQIKNCRNMNLSPAMLLSSLQLSETSVTRYLKNLLDKANILNLKQYFWLEYLRDITWLELLFATYSLQPDSLVMRNLKKSLRRDLPILNNTKFWNNCHDSYTRDFIQEGMASLLVRML